MSEVSETERSTSALVKDNEMLCRICYEESSQAKPLISPCKCIGSMKHVHEECLKTWIIARNVEVVKSNCELCKTPFKMQLDIKLVCKCQSNNSSKVPRLLHYFMIIAAIVGLCVSAWILVDHLNSYGDTERNGLIVGLIVNSFLLLLLVIALAASISKDSKCIHTLLNWKILERQQAVHHVSRPTEASGNYTYEASPPSNEATGVPTGPEILVVPEEISVRGYRVQVPVMSPSLSRLRTLSESVHVYIAYPTRSQQSASSLFTV